MFCVFVYNNLANKVLQKKLKLKVQHSQIAEVVGALYMIHQEPILVQDSIKTTYKKVFGCILTFNDIDRFDTLNILDAYHGCSMNRISLDNPYDLAIKQITYAYPIIFNTYTEFVRYKYKCLEPIQVITYIANTNNKYVNERITSKTKIRNGICIYGFRNILIGAKRNENKC